MQLLTKSKANAYVDVLKSERQYDYNNGVATIRSERSWDRNQSRVVDLVQFANGSQGCMLQLMPMVVVNT